MLRITPARSRRRLGLGTFSLVVLALLVSGSPAGGAAPIGAGKTVAFAFSRSSSAGAAAGACGTRLQCFKAAIVEASAATTPTVESTALALINVDSPDQDLGLTTPGKQLLIRPDDNWNGNATPDFADAVNKVSLGGMSCFTCALQAVHRSFFGERPDSEKARPDSPKVIVFVSERVSTYPATGYNGLGVPTGYPPMTLAQMAGQFDANTVVRAFAVGPAVTCAADPNGFGSLNDVARVTPGGTCTEVAGFAGLGAVLTDAVNGAGSPPPPDTTAPTVTVASPLDGSSTGDLTPVFSGSAGTEASDEQTVTVRVWQGSDTAAAPLETLVGSVSAGAYSVEASPALAEGAYTAQVEQRDAAGNAGSASVAFAVAVPAAGSQAYADSVRADAPRAFWRLGLLDVDAGVAVAEGESAHAGSYVGGAVLGVPPATHDEDAAARFDGGNDMVRIIEPFADAFDFGTGDFTAEAWIKPSASDERVIVSKRSSNAAEPYWAITVTDDSNHNGQIRAVFFDGTGTRTAYSSRTVVDGAWHHVAVLFDRDSGITIAVDGETKLTALAIAADVGNTGDFLIGKGANNPYFKGDLDEVALYSGLLPLQRIQAHLAAAAA